jgi:hypothetical protein
MYRTAGRIFCIYFPLIWSRVRLKPDGTWWRMGGEVTGKLVNGVGSQYSNTTLERGVSSITTADAHTSAASSWLNWRPRRFKWTRPFRRKKKSGLCACAIMFHTESTITLFEVLSLNLQYYPEIWSKIFELDVLPWNVRYYAEFQIATQNFKTYPWIWGTTPKFEVLYTNLTYSPEIWGNAPDSEVVFCNLRYYPEILTLPGNGVCQHRERILTVKCVKWLG